MAILLVAWRPMSYSPEYIERKLAFNAENGRVPAFLEAELPGITVCPESRQGVTFLRA